MKKGRDEGERERSIRPAHNRRSFILCLPPASEVVKDSRSRFEVHTPAVKMPVGRLGPGMLAALKKLAAEGGSETELARLVMKAEGASALPRFYFYLLDFDNRRLLCRRVCSDRRPLATSVPVSSGYKFETGGIDPRRRYVISRFAFCRRAGEEIVIESPLSHARTILHDGRAMALLGELSRPCLPSALNAKACGLSERAASLLLQLFSSAALLSEVDDDGESMEERDAALSQWEFHDLLFHSRSRAGRHSNPYGGTNHLVGKVAPPAAIKPEMTGDSIDLYRPDIEMLLRTDVPLTKVIEDRRSRREHGRRSITGREMGEFLYRSARIRRVFSIDGYDFTDRVYPGGGAAYELELYLAVDRCKGVSAGLYHYDPFDHKLCRLSRKTRAVEQLLERAAKTAHATAPQVLIIIAARFQRMSWRYESISYATILKDVGVLYEAMYLVATAMGLSACALGGGDSDLFAEAAGTNYYLETSVGEFILGR
ncbi:MAG TPA: SagB family peptide dehydrogenase [Blastocatellia bacterium]|nr:SagB family peptide dehydrogenase [Blastocatellia bacterium]